MSAISPHWKREQRRSSRPVTVRGGRSQVRTTWQPSPWRSLKVWKNSSCGRALPARNWAASSGSAEGGGAGQAVRVADNEPLEGELGVELLSGGRAGDDGGDGRGAVQGREIGGVAVAVTLRRHDLEAEGDRPSEDAAHPLG